VCPDIDEIKLKRFRAIFTNLQPGRSSNAAGSVYLDRHGVSGVPGRRKTEGTSLHFFQLTSLPMHHEFTQVRR
jgi:hypothetical protein